jgi:hypothetical protein
MNLQGVHMVTPNEDELPAMCSNGGKTIEEHAQEILDRGVEKFGYTEVKKVQGYLPKK